MPPLTFTTDEAITLLLGTDLATQNVDTQYRGAAQSASHKIAVVLPEQLRREVEDLESSIQFMALNGPAAPETLRQWRQAIIQRRTVCFRYHARYHDGKTSAPSLPEADPYALLHIGGTRMLIAYCHLRRDSRHFQLDRMGDIVILNKGFTRPPDFKIQHGGEDDRTVVVQALFDPEMACRVREAPSSYEVAQEEHPEGLLVTFTVRRPSNILKWLLGWGGARTSAC